VGGWTMVQLRRWNALWARRWRDTLEDGSHDAVMSLQLLGMTTDLVRGALLTALAYAVLSPLTDACLGLWSTDARVSRAVVVSITSSIAAGAAWKLFHSTAGARWFFMSGLAVGLVLLFAR